MQLRYLRNETQAQATTAAAAVGPRQRVEAFEHATDGVVRYARAAIGNVDAHATGFPLHPDVDHAATRCEVDGIVEQVGDRLPQTERIALHPPRCIEPPARPPPPPPGHPALGRAP